MPTSQGVSEPFSTAKAIVTYFQAASGVAAGVGVGRPAEKPGGVGSAGGKADSTTLSGTTLRAEAAGSGVAVAAGARRVGGADVGRGAAGAAHAISASMSIDSRTRRTAGLVLIGPDQGSEVGCEE